MTSRETGDGINSQGSLINLNNYDSKTKRRGESIETYQGVNNNSIQNDINSSSKVSLSKGKIMTLRSLHEVIYEIYSSKIKYDQKCHNNKLPLENMDQYMYTFLN